eukprot:5751261-Pleurochrysis_carterae.AAC.1
MVPSAALSFNVQSAMPPVEAVDNSHCADEIPTCVDGESEDTHNEKTKFFNKRRRTEWSAAPQ